MYMTVVVVVVVVVVNSDYNSNNRIPLDLDVWSHLVRKLFIMY